MKYFLLRLRCPRFQWDANFTTRCRSFEQAWARLEPRTVPFHLISIKSKHLRNSRRKGYHIALLTNIYLHVTMYSRMERTNVNQAHPVIELEIGGWILARYGQKSPHDSSDMFQMEIDTSRFESWFKYKLSVKLERLIQRRRNVSTLKRINFLQRCIRLNELWNKEVKYAVRKIHSAKRDFERLDWIMRWKDLDWKRSLEQNKA